MLPLTHPFTHSDGGKPCQVLACPMGAVWASVSCPRTLWHVDRRSNCQPCDRWMNCSTSWATAARRRHDSPEMAALNLSIYLSVNPVQSHAKACGRPSHQHDGLPQLCVKSTCEYDGAGPAGGECRIKDNKIYQWVGFGLEWRCLGDAKHDTRWTCMNLYVYLIPGCAVSWCTLFFTLCIYPISSI